MIIVYYILLLHTSKYFLSFYFKFITVVAYKFTVYMLINIGGTTMYQLILLFQLPPCRALTPDPP